MAEIGDETRVVTSLRRKINRCLLNYFSELFALLYISKPEMLKSSAVMKVDEILEHATMDELIESNSSLLGLYGTDLNPLGDFRTGESQRLEGYKKTSGFAFNLLSIVRIAREIVKHRENTFTLKQNKRTKK